MSGRLRSGLYVPIPWVKTEIITDIGGSSVMEEYLLRVLTPSSGGITVVRKRYLAVNILLIGCVCFLSFSLFIVKFVFYLTFLNSCIC